MAKKVPSEVESAVNRVLASQSWLVDGDLLALGVKEPWSQHRQGSAVTLLASPLEAMWMLDVAFGKSLGAR
jgi:hypothetical protein